jgi:shikimate kinase
VQGSGSPPHGRSLAFIGFMGAGKSTAARSAATLLGMEAVDVDAVLEHRLGKPIERVFAEDGEAVFRAAEERVTTELLDADWPRAVSLGGGAIGSESVRAALAEHFVVWIDVPVDVAWARARGTGRPLAADRGRFERLYAEREPVYRRLADAIVPAERSHAMAQVLPALDGLPPRAKLLWAASASGDYPVFVGPRLLGVEQLGRDPLLLGPEDRLAVLGEHALDRLSEPLLEHRVDVDRLQPQQLGRAPGRRALARPHEADEGQRPAVGRAPGPRH